MVAPASEGDGRGSTTGPGDPAGDVACHHSIPKRQADGNLGPGSPWHGLFGARWVDLKDDAILLDPRVTQGPVREKSKGWRARSDVIRIRGIALRHNHGGRAR